MEFAVDEEGHIPFAKVKKGVDSDLDAEALRVVRAMPAWTPGMHKGKNVKVLIESSDSIQIEKGSMMVIFSY